MKSLKIDEATALNLYKTASNELKEIFHKTFGEDFFKPKSIFDGITGYKTFCKISKNYEITRDDFSEDIDEDIVKKLIAIAKIKQLEKYFNQGWIANYNDLSEKKWYIWLEKRSSTGGWVFSYSFYCYFSGRVGVYKTKEISDFIGNNKEFLQLYIDTI